MYLLIEKEKGYSCLVQIARRWKLGLPEDRRLFLGSTVQLMCECSWNHKKGLVSFTKNDSDSTSYQDRKNYHFC